MSVNTEGCSPNYTSRKEIDSRIKTSYQLCCNYADLNYKDYNKIAADQSA